jgi:hypothetical protein
MSMIKSFEDLEIWKLAHSISLNIYKIVRSFPKTEDFFNIINN